MTTLLKGRAALLQCTSLLRHRIVGNLRHLSRPASQDKDESEEPVKYTTSEASKWTARQSHGGNTKDIPWFQPYVVIMSTTAFLVYFCILREESDLDDELTKTLYERMPGLEQKQLELSLAYNKEHGLSTTDIENRLQELKNQ